jgi:ribosomal protein S27AE
MAPTTTLQRGASPPAPRPRSATPAKLPGAQYSVPDRGEGYFSGTRRCPRCGAAMFPEEDEDWFCLSCGERIYHPMWVFVDRLLSAIERQTERDEARAYARELALADPARGELRRWDARVDDLPAPLAADGNDPPRPRRAARGEQRSERGDERPGERRPARRRQASTPRRATVQRGADRG